MPPPCFSRTTRSLRCPPSLHWVRPSSVPQPPQYYEGTKTSGAEYGLTYGFACPPQRLFPRFAPLPVETPAAAWPRSSPVPLAVWRWSYTGSPRFLENPSHASALLSDPGRSGWPHPSGQRDVVPTDGNMRTPALKVISGLNHTASASAAYASGSALPHSHARLASGGWLALAGRESNPLDSDERFRSNASDFLLSQAEPGATHPNPPPRAGEGIYIVNAALRAARCGA